MAPLLGLADDLSLAGLARSAPMEMAMATLQERSHRSSSNATMLTGLSLGFGLLSTLSTAFAFFWFVKMRRSFRHE